jgi:hypothetical protein
MARASRPSPTSLTVVVLFRLVVLLGILGWTLEVLDDDGWTFRFREIAGIVAVALLIASIVVLLRKRATLIR